MATGKKDGDREAELETRNRGDPGRDVEAWADIAEAAPRDCAHPAKVEERMRVRDAKTLGLDGSTVRCGKR
jgi:hypothetical protein